MSQKTDKPLDTQTKADVKAASAPNTTAQAHMDTQPATETPETPQQAEIPEALVKPETNVPDNAAASKNAKETHKAIPEKAADGGLPAELLELVSELRDTVKGINPKKHTAKTLKRTLANVSDILTDIEKIYHKS